MASVTFTPTGSQLDSDAIADLALNPGNSFTASFILDTSGLDSDLQSLNLRIDQDFGEVQFSLVGNEGRIFYSDRNSFASGDADLARITDFNPQEDKILLFGFAEQYTLDFLPNSNGSIDAKLIYDSGLDSGSEPSALIDNIDSDLSIDDNAFAFI